MKSLRTSGPGFEVATFAALVCILAISCVLTSKHIGRQQSRLTEQGWISPKTVHTARRAALNGPESDARADGKQAPPSRNVNQALFTGELRVAAIGSAYPIPYAAEICPFTKIPQPAMNQLDRDGDGITDDWELKYGLDKYNKADALADQDEDGFSNIEEFNAGTEPGNAGSHPPYVEKLRFVERKDIPFPLVFQGVTTLSDGNMAFQINAVSSGLTHFAALGESVEGVLLQRFISDENGGPMSLIVSRGGVEIELIRGEISADPESQAELINILDRSSIMVTMGALLSLRNDEYAVLSVHPDKVVVKQIESGKVFDIIGLTDEER